MQTMTTPTINRSAPTTTTAVIIAFVSEPSRTLPLLGIDVVEPTVVVRVVRNAEEDVDRVELVADVDTVLDNGDDVDVEEDVDVVELTSEVRRDVDDDDEEDVGVVEVTVRVVDDVDVVLAAESPMQETATSSWCPQLCTPHAPCEHSPTCLSVPSH